MSIFRPPTLGIGKVGDGNGVAVLGLGNLAVEDNIGTAGRAGTKVLLPKLVNLSLERGTGL